jgi:phosphatidylethanolamine/phosphatidyl-N-methylethanolamine N-methyltransferase
LESIESFYGHSYAATSQQGFMKRYHNYTHRSLEKGLQSGCFPSVLEVGANTGEHFPFVVHSFQKYIASDIRYSESGEVDYWTPTACEKIEFCYADIQKLPFEEKTFDRVIVTCVLHHVQDEMSALKELKRVTKPGGTVSVLLSSDPSLMYRMAWNLTSRKKLIKSGSKNPHLQHALEHQGSSFHISQLLYHVFAEDMISERRYPLSGLPLDLSLFSVIQIKIKG